MLFIGLQVLFLFLVNIQESEGGWWLWNRRRRSPPPPPPCKVHYCLEGDWGSWFACSHSCGNAGTQTRYRQYTVRKCGSCTVEGSQTIPCNRDVCVGKGVAENGYCRCYPGLEGTCCDKDINECVTTKPCQHRCTNTYGSYTCQCNPCYTKIGTQCELRQCLIGGNCYAYGTVNPWNQCQDCNSGNKLSWTNNNILPCNDGQSCTKADHCSNGRCVGTPFTCLPCEKCESDICKVKPGYCTIAVNGSKACFNHKELRPGHPCQECDSNNPYRWTNNNNLLCSDSNIQTKDDRCVSGVCRGIPYSCLPCEQHDGSGCPLKTGHCIIQHNGQKTCFAKESLRPGNPCQLCNETSSVSTWTNRNNVSCDDGNRCSKSDTCINGQCTGVLFTCDSHCQICNGLNCSQKTGFGFVNGSCTCQISGHHYSHQQLNPANQCQWCDLYDVASKTLGTWINRPSVPCDDGIACTFKDMCNNSKCIGQSYSCQSSYPSSSCVTTSVCLGDGKCRDIMRSVGTICRGAKDACDRPERCNGQLGACPANITDAINISTGAVQLQDPSFTFNISYQHATDSIYLSITDFHISCGAMKYKWYLLDGSSACTTSSISKKELPNTNIKQKISGLNLQDNKSYKIVIQAVDMRETVRPLVCSSSVTIDTTKPQMGWVHDGISTDIDFQATKTISANWGGFISRNGVDKYEWKVMYTADDGSAEIQLLTFTSNGVSTKASKIFNNIVDGSKIKVVVRAFTKAGLYTNATSDGVLVDLSKPRTAKIYNGPITGVDVKYAKWTNTFTANWDPFSDPHSGILRYEFAVKRGNSLITTYKSSALIRSFTATSLNLVSGETYCAVIRGFNKAGLYTEAESDCVLIDRDPPQAGSVNDGLSSDIQHQSNGSAISANWSGFNDGVKGSGIVGYQYKITSDKSDVVGWISVGMKTSITHTGLGLSNGAKYYVTVTAIDAVGLSTDVISNGVIVDTTRPIFTGKIYVRGISDVRDGKPCIYTKSNKTLYVNWNGFSDGHSGISYFEWAVIPATQSVKPSDFKRLSGSSLTTSASFSGLSLKDGQLYKVIIRAYNRAFLYTDATSDTIIPDSSPPNAGNVSDGLTKGKDIDYQTSVDSVKATWTVFKEPNTRVRQYYYAVGSCSQGNYHITNNQFMAVTPPLQTSMSIENLNLVNGQRYCTKVKATNMAGVYSQEVTSDGFVVDNTPPDINSARVIDGSTQVDIDYQSNLTDMSASWHGIKDPESGIKFFEYGVSRKRAGSPDVVSFQNVGLQTSAQATGLSLNEEFYYFLVCAINNAGLRSCLSSDGVLVELMNASKGTVNDGIIEPDLKYQSSLTSFAANWEGIWDLESQVERFEWAVKDTTKDENVVLPYEDVGLATHVTNNQPIRLVHSNTYRVYLKVYNNGGSVHEIKSDGVTVDTTAPHSKDIFAGEPGNIKDWIYNKKDKIFYTSKLSDIYAYWDDFTEHESEVWFYKWAIGTTRCGTQIQPYINIGHLKSANTTESNVKLMDGIKYYASVTSRNKANLVSRSCSDAFVIDRSPPSTGTVIVGDSDRHHTYVEPHNVVIYWKDFNDRESGIDHCDIVISNSSSDVLINRKIEGHSGNVSVPEDMLQSSQVYKSVVTCINKANLGTTQTSSPFIVDKTPPVFRGQITAGISRDETTQYQSDTKSIRVTWPSFTDPDSLIKDYWLAIGTTPLEDNIVPLHNVGLATDVLTSVLSLKNATKYYITVICVNAAGLNSSAQGLPLLVDVTPPVALNGSIMDGIGEIDWEHINPSELVSGHWERISDPESGILKSTYCIGLGPFSCQVKDVADIGNKTSFTCNNCKLNPGTEVFITVKVTNGAGLSTTLASNGMTMDVSPPVISEIIDGDDPTGKDTETALLHWNVSFTWQGAEDRESGITKCLWAITDDNSEVFTYTLSGPYKFGIKYTVSTEQHFYTFVPFNSSKLYYNVIECINGARLKRIARSNGFRVVTQWPVPGDVRDGAVFEKDLEYLTSTKDVQVNWDAFQADSRDPVSNYAWAIGSRPGQQDIMKFKDAGLTLQDAVTLAPDEIDLDILFPGQKYYITVKGTSVSGLSSYKSSNGFIVDITPPMKSVIMVKSVVSDNSQGTVDLHIDWSGLRDNESDILESKYCVGTTPFSCVADEIVVGGDSTIVFSSFKPVSMAGYYVMVSVTNKARLTTVMTSEEILIDTTPPSRGKVIDGVDHDRDYINTTDTISVLWTGFEDKDTIVNNCTWKLIESSASSDGLYFGNNITIFEQSVDFKGQATRDGLSLKPGARYISNISCTNRDGFSVSSSSSGVTIDLTPPASNVVIDGLNFAKDIDFTSDTSTVTTVWKEFTDNESSIIGYRWGLGTSPGKDDVVRFRDVGMLRQGKAKNISLVPGGPYYITVKGTNGAGLLSQGWSDGFIVDLSPPQITKIKLDSRAWIGTKDCIAVSWETYDLESPITTVEYCIGTTAKSCQIKQFTKLPAGSTNLTCSDCILKNLGKYYATIRVWNQANLFSLATTEKVQVDWTPPAQGKVVPLSQYLTCAQNCTLSFNVSGFVDKESGLTSCQLVVKNATRTLTPFISFVSPNIVSIVILTAEHGQYYYADVSCTDKVGLVVNSTSETGVLVDLSPPTKGTVTISPDQTHDFYGIHSTCHLYNTTLRVHWSGFDDIETGLTGFRVSLHKENSSYIIAPPKNVSSITTSTTIDVDIERGVYANDVIYAVVEAFNRVGLATSAQSPPTRLVSANNEQYLEEGDFFCLNV